MHGLGMLCCARLDLYFDVFKSFSPVEWMVTVCYEF